MESEKFKAPHSTSILSNRSPVSNSDVITIQPKQCKFQNVKLHEKYEIPIFLRNESKQTQKLRIIHPKNPFFKIGEQTCHKSIAPGLSTKINVVFHYSEPQSKNAKTLKDEVIVLGNKFMKKIQIQALLRKSFLEIPKIFKLGTLKSGKDYKFQIPIVNKGSGSDFVSVESVSTPDIYVYNSNFGIADSDEEKLLIKTNFKTIGLIKETININNEYKINIRGVCIDEKIQICNQNGERFSFKDFGQIYIGEVVKEHFFILNNSPHEITGLARTFSKNHPEYMDVVIDEKRENFIIKQTPEVFTKEKENLWSRIKEERFSVPPFEDFQNVLILEKKPNQSDLKWFQKNINEKEKDQNISEISLSSSQITETLFCKVLKEEKSCRIPIKFTPILPKIALSSTHLIFGKVEARKSVKKILKIKNRNERQLKVSFSKSKNFTVQGDMYIQGLQENQYIITFRPLIIRNYHQKLQISFFSVWKIEITLKGICEKVKNFSVKTTRNIEGKENANSFSVSKTHNLMNSTSYLTMQRLKRNQKKNKAEVKIRLEGLKTLQRENGIPFNPLYDASQIPKLRQTTGFSTVRQKTSELFFKKQQYNTCIAQKKTARIYNKLNLKQLYKFTEELNAEQLRNVQVMTNKIQYGHVFINSVSQKELTIKNRNDTKAIVVELDLYGNQSLKQTKDEIKKIEPYSEAKFTINLKPMKLGYLQIPLGYVINKKHIFQVELTANVTLVNLQLSTKNLNFFFADNDLSFEKKAMIMIQNHGNTPTKFTFIQPTTKSFHITTAEEQIMPHSSIQATVTYNPVEGNDSGSMRVEVDKILMKVIGGAEDVIKCVGSVNQPKCSVRETEINLGDVLISTVNSSKLTIRNHSKIDAVVKIEMLPLTLSDNVKFQTKLFDMYGDQRRQIQFYIHSNEIKQIKGNVIISVRGGKVFRIPIWANFVYPQIEVINIQQAVDFGKIPILKNQCQKEIILKNRTKCEIKLELNNFLKEKAEYCLEIIANKEELVQLSYQREYETSDIFSNTNIIAFSCHDMAEQKKLNDLPALKIIKLLPGVQSVFSLKFVPKLIKKYDLKIPLFLHKASRIVEPIDKRIKCQGIQPIIYIHPQTIEFENAVILQSRQCYKKEVQIVNPHSKVTAWKIAGERGSYSIFYFSEYEGTLQPNEKIVIEAFFRPIKEGKESKIFSLFLDDETSSSFELQVIGSAVLPTLTFKSNYVIVPVVPLYVQSRTVVQLQNEGYDTITLSKWKLSQTFQHTEMKVNFIEGKLLSLAKKTLKVEVCFYSEVPISFTTTLELYDEYGEKYSIPVSATAENSVMTVYPFLENDNNYSVVMDANEGIVKALCCKSKCYEINTVLTGKNIMSASFIRKWCNYELNMSIQRFPECFIESNGEALHSLLSKITNGRQLVKKLSFGSEEKVNRVYELWNYYSEVIRSLQVEGAFLNQIRPEFLLSYNDYLIFLTNQKMHINKDQNFEVISHEAWTALFYQICKLYVQHQIPEKNLYKLSKNNKQEQHSKIQSSTLYSDIQLHLLNYLNTFIPDERVYNLNETARILQMLQKIIQKLFDINLMEILNKIKLNGQTFQESLSTITKFLHTQMQELGLSLYLEHHDFLSMGSKEFILYFISLVNTIIYYQNATNINFETSLGEKVSRVIQLQNPSSSKKIRYWIKLVGSENFCPEVKEISIQGREKKEVVVTYLSKISRNENAKLVLIPCKDEDGHTAAQPLCFNLKATLITKLVVKRMCIVGTLYEIIPFSMDIEVPTNTNSGQFTIYIIEQNEEQQDFCPTFFLMGQEKRSLANGRDKLELKIAPLELGKKICKIVYVCPIVGQFSYQLSINVSPPSPMKEIRIRSLKASKEEIFQVNIPRENHSFVNCLNFIRDTLKSVSTMSSKNYKNLWPYLYPSLKKKIKKQFIYSIAIIDSNEIIPLNSFVNGEEAEKSNGYGINFQKLEFKGVFRKPHRQYGCSLILRNQLLKDFRIYRILTSIILKPKTISLSLTTRARETLKQSFPIKLHPCSISYSKNCTYFRIDQIQQDENGKSEYMATFRPEWLLDEEINVYVENKETFQQYTYKVRLVATEPKPVQDIKINGSQYFSTQIQIDMSSFIVDNGIFDELLVKSQIRRRHEIAQKYRGEKVIKMILHPGIQPEMSSIKLFKPQSDQYYEILTSIKNKELHNLGVISLSSPINHVKKHTISNISIKQNDFQFTYKSEFWLSHEINENGKNQFAIIFSPNKELQEEKDFYFLACGTEYQLRIKFSAPKMAPVTLPDIMTENTISKAIVIPISNISIFDGVYTVDLESQGCYKLDSDKVEIKKKQKSAIKIFFQPQYIGQIAKATIFLKSELLPDYIYYLVGCSTFKKQEEYLQFQSLSERTVLKKLSFKNQFSKIERFKIQLEPLDCQYMINQQKIIFTEIKPECEEKFQLVYDPIKTEDKSTTQNAKIVVSKTFDKKIVKVFYLKLLFVRKFQNKIYTWNCKARETIFQTINIGQKITLLDVETAPEIKKSLTYTTDDKNQGEVKIKFSPLKPIKRKKYSLIFCTEECKYRVNCLICVNQPQVDDTIKIRTDEICEVGCVYFKLTNITKQPAFFKATFEKGSPELQVQPSTGMLQPYGRIGTNICVKFTSEVHNKRIDDKLIIETEEMYWLFKVRGIQSKKLNY